MSSDHAQLLDSILNFDIDGTEGISLPFAARLASEHGWSRSYAERVIVEYKRFVYLAMTAGKPVCPSEDVDAAWHLHLTYTRSYWQRFCGEVLGRPLHHDPTRGGPADSEKHRAMYAATLIAYRTTFDFAPPSDIWTPVRERFGDDLAHQSVNTSRNWVIPKAPIRSATLFAVLVAIVVIFLPGCQGGLNPFALNGADFLYFLIPTMLLAALLGRLIRSRLSGPRPPEDEDYNLTWEQTAYVSGGSARLTTAAIARMVGYGVAAVEGTRLVRGGHGLENPSPVEKAVWDALPFSNDSSSLKPVAKAVEAAFADEARILEQKGFLMSAAAMYGVFWMSGIPLFLVLLGLGFPQVLFGLVGNNGGPSINFFIGFFGFMISLTLLSAGLTRRTRKGDHALEKLKARNAELKTVAALDGTYDAGLAVALFGTGALAGSSIAALHMWYPRQTTGDASGGCGTGGCSAGGDGGGCGGGGCGGGGD